MADARIPRFSGPSNLAATTDVAKAINMIKILALNVDSRSFVKLIFLVELIMIRSFVKE